MRTEREPLSVNGAHGEGGGALFRTALALSALTQTPVRLHQIRGGTRKPGLTSEDLTFTRMVEAVCSAEVQGDNIGSNEVILTPKRAPKALRGVFDVQEHEKGQIPGNALMLAESILPVLARTGAYSSFTIHGETFNNHTLTFDAFSLGTLALHAKQGLVGFASLRQAGFGYAGQGEVEFEAEPSALQGFEWMSRGELTSLDAIITHHGVAKDVPERAEEAFRKAFQPYSDRLEILLNEVDARSNGVHVTLVAKFEKGLAVASAMGTRGLRVEIVCKHAIEQLADFTSSDATLDPYLADQALLCAALAPEPTQFKTNRITPRLQTMASVIRQFIPIPITLLGRLNEPGTVKVG